MSEAGCPVPPLGDDLSGNLRGKVVELAHGAGGRRSHELVRQVFLPAFAPIARSEGLDIDGLAHDASLLLPTALDPGFQSDSRLALTTDGYVVSPRFFPGGDIGTLSVFGTLNDLAMVGACPRALTASFVLEEGLPLAELQRIARSMASAASGQGVRLLAGDTKVVERGRGDGVYVSTTGIGVAPAGLLWSPERVRPGDQLIVSGEIGCHGLAVLAARENLGLVGQLESDCAALWPAVAALRPLAQGVACLRDLTRGGLGIAACELAASTRLRFELQEEALAVAPAVEHGCELLGLDPLYLACEGRFLACVRPAAADAALAALRSVRVSRGARVVGEVRESDERLFAAPVVLRGALGSCRPIDWSGADQLPRIC